MSNQENPDTQPEQEDVQNLAEEQLEGVTGGGGVISKVAKVFTGGGKATKKRTFDELNPGTQQLANWLDENAANLTPSHWKVIPKNPNEGARHA